MTGWVCPFCGGPGPRSREHVWGRWLHELPAAKTLLAGSSGERNKNAYTEVRLGENGRFEAVTKDHGHWARLLPHVTVEVCRRCNNGWMSGLESAVQGLISPLVFDGDTTNFGPGEQQLLAAWAAEMFMAYALTEGPLDNPFSKDDYRYIANSGKCPRRFRIWMAAVHSRNAQVGMRLFGWTIGETFDPTSDQYNSALGFVAVGGLVFLLVVLPDGLEKMHDVYSPPCINGDVPMVELTAPLGTVEFGGLAFGEGYFDLIDQWFELPRRAGLSVGVGMAPDELARERELFIQGMPLDAIRSMRPDLPASQETQHESRRREQEAIAEAERFVAAGDIEGAGLALTRRGREHFNMRDFEGAARLLVRAHELPGSGLETDPEAAYRIGQCYWNLNDSRAEEWYLRAIELGLDAPEPRFGIVDTRYGAGRYAEALSMLEEIQPETPRQVAIRFVAANGLRFLVEELGLTSQVRDVDGLADLADVAPSPDVVLDMLQSSDATNRMLWRMATDEDPRAGYHFARAWFGDHPISWFMVTMIVAEQDPELAEAIFALGLERIPELFLAADSILNDLEDSGVGNLPVGDVVRRVLARLRD